MDTYCVDGDYDNCVQCAAFFVVVTIVNSDSLHTIATHIYTHTRYKHFSQLCTLLRGELSLTLEETLRNSGGDKEHKDSSIGMMSISSSCQAKLNQFPTLPARVSDALCSLLAVFIVIFIDM